MLVSQILVGKTPSSITLPLMEQHSPHVDHSHTWCDHSTECDTTGVIHAKVLCPSEMFYCNNSALSLPNEATAINWMSEPKQSLTVL